MVSSSESRCSRRILNFVCVRFVGLLDGPLAGPLQHVIRSSDAHRSVLHKAVFLNLCETAAR